MIEALYPSFRHWSHNGSVYLIGDTHFGDEQLAAAMLRPSSEQLLSNLNNRVFRHDTLILLGDAGDPTYCARIKARKVLIAGNHDTNLTQYQDIFDEIYSGPLICGEKILLSHEPISVSWALNFHGHNHKGTFTSPTCINCCADVINYTPLNLGQYIRANGLKAAVSIHRQTIDFATERKAKRTARTAGL